MVNNLDIIQLRKEISDLDEDIAKLLEKRFELVLKVGQYKIINNLPVFDETREKDVISKCKKNLSNSQYENYLEKIYSEIMNTCKEIQKNEIKKL